VLRRDPEAATLADVVELLAGIGTTLMVISATLQAVEACSQKETMTMPTPDDRRREREELRAQAKAARENMQAIIDRVEARMQERRERRERGLLRRIFSR
jgi:predicted lipoprotein